MPLIATNCVKNSTLYPVLEKVRYVDRHTYETWFRGHPEPGDLIFVCKGSPGQVCLAPDPVSFCIAQDMVAIRADPKRVYPAYLFAALRSPEVQFDIGNMHVGTLIPHFKKGDFDKLSIPLPPPAQQRIIGDWHLAIESKIDLNRRMNETLEAMAQAIFRDWFVDFGPVRRKMAGATDPVAIMGGLTPDPTRAAELAALFSDALGDDDLPVGWSDAPLSAHLQIIGGGTPKTNVPEFWDGDIPWFSVVDTPPGSDVFVFDTEKSITPEGVAGSSARLIAAGTTIISARGTVGNLAMAAREMTFNQSCYALQSSRGDHACFVYLLAAHAVEQLRAMAHGSVFSTITRQTFDAMSFPTAPSTVLSAVESLLRTLFDRVKAAVDENRTLAETRDYLLPRLMSGEVRVGDAALEIAA
ncbi:restriction endonuclease subunit S [Sphingobium sp. DEHP117]|uniref:restriction endonuclease subunit S n=1 Tax=Sphingobium sp. DEHP117 TaxID=2993436 RepID=UPI0027D53E8E|nr:restriction endonuclease subunit S [Sphingobium sp. DEHP117]MDQ4421689.1 restriction endonuclease subunit S [Sphingobium sp. DEHP117]